MVTPSFIPSFATRGPDADLSSEGSENVLEEPDDEPTMKKRVSDFEEEVPSSLILFIYFFVISFLYIYICVTPLLRSPFILHVHSSNCRDL